MHPISASRWDTWRQAFALTTWPIRSRGAESTAHLDDRGSALRADRDQQAESPARVRPRRADRGDRQHGDRLVAVRCRSGHRPAGFPSRPASRGRPNGAGDHAPQRDFGPKIVGLLQAIGRLVEERQCRSAVSRAPESQRADGRAVSFGRSGAYSPAGAAGLSVLRGGDEALQSHSLGFRRSAGRGAIVERSRSGPGAMRPSDPRSWKRALPALSDGSPRRSSGMRGRS